ncbi:hypothetical protein D9757_000149 [Collybiopsis confluens]|uniref:CsbD-like domain-containing protein n=1 Tax=Collybiopsis confluens TaxID=2823264 RepID=A0A8H5I3D4_9AGAR|nr:hypothetical protein D9757_000149 [Collybiopsis confluens]
MPLFEQNNNHTTRDTALGAGAGGLAGHEGHHGHTARDTALGAFTGREAGHHGNGAASGTHGNRDGLLGAGAGAAVGHGSGHTARDAAIGGIGGEVLGRHHGKGAHSAGGATGTAGVTGTNTAHPTKMHGKLEEIEGKVERGVGKVTGSTSLGLKGEDKIIAGQREQVAAAGHRQADVLENQAAAHRNRAEAMHPSGRY